MTDSGLQIRLTTVNYAGTTTLTDITEPTTVTSIYINALQPLTQKFVSIRKTTLT